MTATPFGNKAGTFGDHLIRIPQTQRNKDAFSNKLVSTSKRRTDVWKLLQETAVLKGSCKSLCYEKLLSNPKFVDKVQVGSLA